MKKIRVFLSIMVLFGLISLIGCGGGDPETDKEKAMKLLTAKQWVVNTVSVPANTATTADDWDNFKVSFTQTNMSTSGHPTGATVVWPSGGYTMNDAATQITRTSDQVVMSFSVSETALSVSFSMPPGTEIGGRVESLEGPYTFNMK